MKIAINATTLLSPHAGVGTYTYQIAKNLKKLKPSHEYTYFYGYYSDRLLNPGEEPRSFQGIKETIRKIPLLGSLARNANDFLNYFSSRKFDLYFEPNFIPLRIPARRTVATILDFSFELFPEWHPIDKVKYFKINFWNKIKKADRIICISDFIRHEATALFGFPEEKLVTIYLGVDHDIFKPYPPPELPEVRNRYRLPPQFILFVGSIEPRKNLKGLLHAYKEFGNNFREEFKLVLAGFQGWKNEEVMGMIRKMEGSVQYLGYVPQIDLAKIYNLASIFVYPSFYEGFGLPPLEAMACGCPVVVSKAASLPEVCGDAAYYVDPEEVTSIAGGISKVLSNEELRASQIKKGIAHADGFRWEKSAFQHLHIFEEVFRGE